VRRLFSIWISYFFFALRNLLADNVGESANEIIREVNEKLNVCYDTTAAESPRSNGTMECANALFYESMMKMTYNTNADSDEQYETWQQVFQKLNKRMERTRNSVGSTWSICSYHIC